MLFQNLTEQELSRCVELACQAIYALLYTEKRDCPPLHTFPEALTQPAACFVTLKVNNELQGCLGCIWPERPLAEEIYSKAIASAHQDPRFSPLRIEQLDALSVEISVLSPPEQLIVADEPALLHYLEQHKPGLILSDGQRQALFLPQVWQQLPSPVSFVQYLKRKAGWPIDYWSPSMQVQTFQVASAERQYRDIYPDN